MVGKAFEISSSTYLHDETVSLSEIRDMLMESQRETVPYVPNYSGNPSRVIGPI